MKVLLINVCNYRKGGAESVCFNTAQLLRNNGHDTIHFSLKWHDNEPSAYDEYFPESKETRRGPLRQLKNFVNYFYHREAARNLDKLITEHKPDIAHIHLMWGQLTGSILPVLKRHNIPIVYTAHDYRLICPAYTFRNGRGEHCEACRNGAFWHCFTNNCCKDSRLYSATMAAEQYFRNAFFNPTKYIDGIIYVSDFARELHHRYLPATKDIKSIKLYNFSTDLSMNNPDKSANKYFLYFGRLSAEKGLNTLLMAFKQLPGCQLKIAGTGPEEEELKKYVVENNMDNVEFLGYKKATELNNIISKAYFTIVPSEWYENNPMSVIESLSLGTPVIGSRIGGIPEIVIDNITGYTFTSGNAESLTEVIKKASALDNMAYYSLVNNIHRFAHDNFNADTYHDELTKFYMEIASNGP